MATYQEIAKLSLEIGRPVVVYCQETAGEDAGKDWYGLAWPARDNALAVLFDDGAFRLLDVAGGGGPVLYLVDDEEEEGEPSVMDVLALAADGLPDSYSGRRRMDETA